jgi:hypothetical protein
VLKGIIAYSSHFIIIYYLYYDYYFGEELNVVVVEVEGGVD